jgi:hypothetical protein
MLDFDGGVKLRNIPLLSYDLIDLISHFLDFLKHEPHPSFDDAQPSSFLGSELHLFCRIRKR